jgi:hypothetical protein
MKAIETILEEINNLGPMLPGKIGRYSNRCSSINCKCKRLKDPKLHGPYNQLSFRIAKKSSTMNIKDEDLEQAKIYIANYKKFQNLTTELVLANVAQIRGNGFQGE